MFFSESIISVTHLLLLRYTNATICVTSALTVERHSALKLLCYCMRGPTQAQNLLSARTVEPGLLRTLP